MELATLQDDLDSRLAARLAELRAERGWSLDQLAEASGVSRATLSRLERGQTSPTASLLGKLCTAYGRTMSRLLAETEGESVQVLRASEQVVWVDPETGFRRRLVSPPASGMNAELIEAVLPEGAVIGYDGPALAGMEQHIWMLSGHLALSVDGATHLLAAGDCLRFRLFSPTRFVAPGPGAARYVLVVCRP
ncbi:MAG TPA: XRE family transcriptional regulator [Acetobacteraceae bacterium]|nr:XRE family transcriptional regulator [Acetobacteraceae bacterium]